MTGFQLAYNLVLTTLGYGALPLLRRTHLKDPAFRQGRLGLVHTHEGPASGEPRLWFHAASVGEVTGAVPTLRVLKDRLPEAMVFLTVGTPQGLRFAEAQLPPWVQLLPFPLDFAWTVRKTLHRLKPDLYVAFESEFWPNLFYYLSRQRIPALLLNGRLTARSARRYRIVHPLFQPIFQQFRWLAAHSDEDARNLLSFGAPAERTLVLGSSKYDGLLMRARPDKIEPWRKRLNIDPRQPVVVGGSLRGSECTDLLSVFEPLNRLEPNLVGIFVPRHLEQIPRMAAWLKERNLAFHLLTTLEQKGEPRTAPIILVDRIGVLFELYALGDLIFCGGTLEPIGGHNILEPAAWEKAVFYGPYVQKVFYEHTMLQRFSGSFLAQNSDDLLRQWSRWIRHIPQLSAHGRKAKDALLTLGGAASKQVDLILNVLYNETPQWLMTHAKARGDFTGL